MDKKIAMVRATNIIPVDGVVRPISNVQYIKKEYGSSFYYKLYDYLKEKGIIEELDYSRFGDENYIEEYNKKARETINFYLPYSSDYNPAVLWALNGIVPDDTNNTFSNKSVAIIDDLDEHISEIISIMPTDTATKGDFEITANGVVLIKREVFEKLTIQEKKQMIDGNARVILFDGDIKEAVDKYLEVEEEYDGEELTLTRSKGGYIESETSNETKKRIKEIAEKNNIPEVLYFDMVTKSEEYGTAIEDKNIYEKTIIVMDFYKEMFLEYMFKRLEDGKDDEQIRNMELTKLDLIKFPEVDKYNDIFIKYIDEYGIENYKKEVEIYNQKIEKLKEKGELLTPEEIVNAKEKGSYINLLERIENLDIEFDFGSEDIE